MVFMIKTRFLRLFRNAMIGRIFFGFSSFSMLFAAFCLLVCGLSGCNSPMEAIDARTEELLKEASANLGKDIFSPDTSKPDRYPGKALTYPKDDLYTPETVNPSADEIQFRELEKRKEMINMEVDDTLSRIDSENAASSGTLKLELNTALAYAFKHAREYKTAEEEYILASLRLLIERHLWGPRFFNDISAIASGTADDNAYESSLQIVNEFRVTQRLPYGGDISARLLARATEDLRLRVAGEHVQNADFILSANVPLLRGAGLAATDSRIQAERNLIYAARTFERFRRMFVVDMSRDFLNLVVQQQNITNAERQLVRLLDFEQRAIALVESGRDTPFQRALASQDVLFAQDSLRSSREVYRFTVDRFKVRLGMPIDMNIEIVLSSLNIPTPDVDINEAVRVALNYRLDIQTRRDQVEDTFRDVDIAKNNLLPDLDLTASFTVPTDENRAREGLRFDTERNRFSAGITFGLPLDREIERLQLRQSQINLQRSEREYDRFRDNLIVEVRDVVREIGRSLFSLKIQEENIRIAELRMSSIDAAPDRATARDRSEAANQLTRAQDDRDRAKRDLEVAIAEYLLSTGTLRVANDGLLKPLSGMQLIEENNSETDETGANINEEDATNGG